MKKRGARKVVIVDASETEIIIIYKWRRQKFAISVTKEELEFLIKEWKIQGERVKIYQI